MTRTIKLLIVDDSLVVGGRLTEMLSGIEGLEVIAQAQTAGEALALVTALRPEVIVLDIQMPNVSGIDILRQVKRDYPLTKVVMFTNHPEVHYRKRCFELKADYFLSKSTDSGLLINIATQVSAEISMADENQVRIEPLR